MWICALSIVVFLSVAMATAWAFAIRSGKSGLIDATWSFAVGASAFAAAIWPMYETDQLHRRLLVAAMAALWSARLGLYIAGRTHAGDDDPRYAALKKEWGAAAPRNLFAFLQIQAVAAWPLALAAGLAAHRPGSGLGLQDMIGVIVFLAGFLGESVADRQMARFRANPANKGGICEEGLWAWSRHPNYFCEWLCWLAYAVLAVDLTGALPAGWLALGAPAVMYWLLVHVSGVPPLEDYLKRSRPRTFDAYASRVSKFWPTPPKAAQASHKVNR